MTVKAKELAGFHALKFEGKTKLNMKGKDLVFISAPEEFDVDGLRGTEVISDTILPLATQNGQNRWNIDSSTPGQHNHTIVIPSADGLRVADRNISTNIRVYENFLIPSLERTKCKQKLVPKPSDLRVRWKPFGTGRTKSSSTDKRLSSSKNVIKVVEDSSETFKKEKRKKNRKRKYEDY